jgi:hypothetical protein
VIKNEPVRWIKSADNPYKGLVKCFVVPPQNLLHPIIPHKFCGKLMFVLCSKCGRDGERKSRRMRDDARRIPTMDLCPHSDEERGFVTTITHLELNAALEKGYTVTHLYSAYHWDEWSKELFAPYIRKFMKIKVEASGWPGNCKDNQVMQQWYVNEWKRRFDITIDPANVKENEGMKLIAKICLNCLWGKWSMRNNLTSCLITDSPTELHNIINDKTLDIGVLEYINDLLMMVTHKKKSNFVTPHKRYNIAISIFTTSAARLRLYSFMDAIASSPNCYLLYTDTGSFGTCRPKASHSMLSDSCFFLYLKAFCPIPTGDFLGEMSEVYPHHDILAYYSAGCKAYALMLRDKRTGKIEITVKIKGITFNEETSRVIHFERFKVPVGDRTGVYSWVIIHPEYRRWLTITATMQLCRSKQMSFGRMPCGDMCARTHLRSDSRSCLTKRWWTTACSVSHLGIPGHLMANQFRHMEPDGGVNKGINEEWKAATRVRRIVDIVNRHILTLIIWSLENLSMGTVVIVHSNVSSSADKYFSIADVEVLDSADMK